MEEKEEIQKKEHKECNCNNTSKIEHLIKFALLLLTLFLATYLAVYYVLDQIRHSYYIPRTQLENIDEIIKAQDRLFDSMGTLPMYNVMTKELNTPIEVYKNEAEKAYKIVIDLKDFNNDPKNIELEITDKEIAIKGSNEINNKNSEKHYLFSQKIVLPEKIEKNKIKKELKRNKYIITLPIED